MAWLKTCARQESQNHLLAFGAFFSPTHLKWYHVIAHAGLSHAIILPFSGPRHTQYCPKLASVTFAVHFGWAGLASADVLSWLGAGGWLPLATLAAADVHGRLWAGGWFSFSLVDQRHTSSGNRTVLKNPSAACNKGSRNSLSAFTLSMCTSVQVYNTKSQYSLFSTQTVAPGSGSSTSDFFFKRSDPSHSDTQMLFFMQEIAQLPIPHSPWTFHLYCALTTAAALHKQVWSCPQKNKFLRD